MDRERRKADISIRENPEHVLNPAQREALAGMKFSGWEPLFLRKPLFQAPVVIVHNAGDGRTGLLDERGRIIVQTNIRLRRQESRVQTQEPAKPLVWTK